MQLSRPHATKHYRARLIAWSLAMLAWLAWAFSADRAPKRRHVRKRYGFISLHGLSLNVAMLILARARELAGISSKAGRFFGRVRGRDRWPRHMLRSCIGGRLRRALRHRDFAVRVGILVGALRNLDAWAARYVNRVRRGVTKRWPIFTAARPQTALVLAATTAAASFADTS